MHGESGIIAVSCTVGQGLRYPLHRTAAFIDLALLLTATFLIKTWLPSRRERPNVKLVDVKSILTDEGYWLCTIRYVGTFDDLILAKVDRPIVQH